MSGLLSAPAAMTRDRRLKGSRDLKSHGTAKTGSVVHVELLRVSSVLGVRGIERDVGATLTG